uniref:Actin filament-associated protein 1-like 2 n=1 Tax=Anas platyrhynchos TaxID=8839 RepID=A0A8B9SRK4_ANAPL
MEMFQLLNELEDFLRILDKENLSSTALVKKSFLSDLLRVYTKTSGGDEEYIYMNKVTVNKQQGDQEKQDKALDGRTSLTNGDLGLHSSPPQKSLPELPPPKIPETKQPLVPKIESPEGYYEEAEPYDVSLNEDGEAVSSSYESYDEEESSKGKSATHQWPSTEATIELMKDARICAFLWRKKWLGQWAKQLCVIKDTRLLCYKSSKDHNPQLDVNLLGCTVIHKEKQVRKKEHKLKIIPMNADVIVLGLQSKDQAEQWLRVSDILGVAQVFICQGRQVPEHFLQAAVPGIPAHREPCVPRGKLLKKGTTGLKLSNLMNLGRKKSSSMDSPERSLETSSYLNVLVNSQWKSRWCQIKDGHLHFYQDKNRSKLAQQPLSLAGCEIIPDPSPDHLYSFRILHNGEERLILEAKSSEEMGHWLDPEEFTYDYVDADRVSCIVSAAKNSFFLMQRKYSEPNAYIDNLPRGRMPQEELYDDVELPDVPEVRCPARHLPGDQDRVYLDLTPVKSFLHCAGKKSCQTSPLSSPPLERAGTKAAPDSADETTPVAKDAAEPSGKAMETSEQVFNQVWAVLGGLVFSVAAVETKLGKNRTEAEVKRFTEEKERLEKEKEEIRAQLTQLRKERRELKEMLVGCTDKSLEQKLKEIEEECKKKESRRVDVELNLVEVKENLKKAESGPVTLGTTVDTTHLENAAPRVGGGTPVAESSPVNSATALKNRPLSVMVTGKGTVLQKAKEWEKKGAS